MLNTVMIHNVPPPTQLNTTMHQHTCSFLTLCRKSNTDHLISSAADGVSHQQLMTWLAFATKTKRVIGVCRAFAKEMQQETVFFCRGKKVKMRISVDKSELWCSPLRVCQAFPSPSLHETTINERADFKGPLGWRDCMSGHLWRKKKKEKVPYCSLAPSLSPLSAFENWQKFRQWQ